MTELSEIFVDIQATIKDILVVVEGSLLPINNYETISANYATICMMMHKLPCIIKLRYHCAWIMTFNQLISVYDDQLSLQRPFWSIDLEGRADILKEVKYIKNQLELYFNALEELTRFDSMDILIPNIVRNEHDAMYQPGAMLNDAQMKQMRLEQSGVGIDHCLINSGKCIHEDWPSCDQCDIMRQLSDVPIADDDGVVHKPKLEHSITLKELEQLGFLWFDNIDNSEDFRVFLEMLSDPQSKQDYIDNNVKDDE